MIPRLLVLVFAALPLAAGTAAEVARAIRENSFDRDECYRVRDLSFAREDIRIYLTDGHLMFSKPVAGKRIAAVFTADVEGGDGELILLPPDRAERRSLATYINSPNLDEHFRAAVFLFTGDDYDQLKAMISDGAANKKTPEAGALLEEEWTPVLRNLEVSYGTRMAFDLLGGRTRGPGLFAGLFSSANLGNFDVSYDPWNPEQILAGHVTMRENRLYFDVWSSFAARSSRQKPAPREDDLRVQDYRIEATVNPDWSMDVVSRVKISAKSDVRVATFDIAPEMQISQVTIDGQPAEVLQRDALRVSLVRGGNTLFLVLPSEPLRAGREYEFEFHHSGKVIHDAGDRVFYVTARGTWYPMHGSQFVNFDLRFRYPRDLDLVSAGDVVEERTDGEWKITRRRTGTPIRMAAFNLGNYAHARLERGGYVVDVCANRTLERALEPRPQVPIPQPPLTGRPRRPDVVADRPVVPPAPNPLERLNTLASEVLSALEFMSSRFGPPALKHVTVSPIPGTFGQGFPGLIYISTLSYLKSLPESRSNSTEAQHIFFQDMLQAHEMAHQWWGNRVAAAGYRDYWLMEALANYSAMLYLEKSKGTRVMDTLMDSYRSELLAKSESGQTVESTGPIVLGWRLSNSQEPRGWRTITYGKGSWVMHMLRERMGTERFFAMLAEMVRLFGNKEVTTEQFREVAARFLPPNSDDPKLESFFDQWIYGTGIPALKLTYSVKGKAPALRLVGTITQSDVDEDFNAVAPVEIQVARGRTVTQWVRTASTAVTFTVPLKQPPLKVTLDPRHAVLRR